MLAHKLNSFRINFGLIAIGTAITMGRFHEKFVRSELFDELSHVSLHSVQQDIHFGKFAEADGHRHQSVTEEPGRVRQKTAVETFVTGKEDTVVHGLNLHRHFLTHGAAIGDVICHLHRLLEVAERC